MSRSASLWRTLPVVAIVAAALAQSCVTRRPTPPPTIARAPTHVPPIPIRIPRAERQQFEATAYSIRGKTASGRKAQKGLVAADPDVLPLGSIIRVYGAGSYSGEYTVADTGPAIDGHEIDIFIPSAKEAKRFGRRSVEVEILRRGTGSNGEDDH
jgi:3D (Asp-Asp-Asp) domain-containing protein